MNNEMSNFLVVAMSSALILSVLFFIFHAIMVFTPLGVSLAVTFVVYVIYEISTGMVKAYAGQG